jgi:CheY-like chemotaxis protein
LENRAKKLLMVDDDVIDAHFVMRAFSAVGGGLQITHVTDGDVAARRLSSEPFDYVLLDINMPGTNGMDLLRRIRTDEKTAIVPVIMLTSSANPSDVHTSYACGANAYAVKPSSVNGYRRFAEGFTRFWVDVAVQPQGQRPS